MDKSKFSGIFPALPTPFDSNNKINEKALESLIKYNIEKGVKGFYVTGSTGEAFLLSADERKYVMEIVKATAPDHTLIAHIGSINEMEAAGLARHAARLSYDLISSVAPFYYKFSFTEIKNYYFRLAKESGLPMLVYYIPAFSGVSMGAKELSVFLESDLFAGIKYTSNDFFTMEQCKTNFPDKIVYNGYDEMFLAGLSMGADGGIGSTYNFMADKFVHILTLMQENKLSEAQTVQKEVNKIITVLLKVGVIPGLKEILNQLGFDMGICRKPFGELTDDDRKLISEEIIPYL